METYYWIVEYNNGKIIPEFDFNTGKKNSFLKIPHDNIKAIHFVPLTNDLIRKIKENYKGDDVFVSLRLPMISLQIPHSTVIIEPRREKHLHFRTIKFCSNCLHTFEPDDKHIVKSITGKIYFKCPICQKSVEYKCKSCGNIFTPEDFTGKCSCGCQNFSVIDYIKTKNISKINTFYITGYELKDFRVVVKIDEIGNVSIGR